MAPTIYSRKKCETRILNNDAKPRKRYNLHKAAAVYSDLKRQQSSNDSRMDVNVSTKTINDALPLNLTCNKFVNISKQMISTTSNCSDINLNKPNIVKNCTRLMRTHSKKNTSFNCCSKPSLIITMPSLPVLRSTNHIRRYSSSSTSVSDTSYDDENNEEEFITDDRLNDYQKNIQNIDEKKRQLYNAILSGNFSDNDVDNTNCSNITTDNSQCCYNCPNESDKQEQNTDTCKDTGISMLIEQKLATIPTSSCSSPSTSLTNYTPSTDDLLAIAIKTVKLVKRNQLLQQRLNQLQLETSAFIESVLNNPENRHFRERVQQKLDKITTI